MQTLNPSTLIISIGDETIVQETLATWRHHEYCSSIRAVKKQFRKALPALIIACIANEQDESIAKDITQFVRGGLKNQDTRIVLMHRPSFILDEVGWMENLQINGCLIAEASKQLFNLSLLNREIDTFLHIETNRRQHDSETEMLMCISRFSRENESLPELLKVFSSALSSLCYSSCCVHIEMKGVDSAGINYCDIENDDMITVLHSDLGLPTLPVFFEKAIVEKQPQVNLLSDDMGLSNFESEMGEKIGSYLTFPIVAYDKALYLLVCFIPEREMNKVSMKQIDIINKASEQLTVLLERREAEASLKKQYDRLKNTMLELKAAKEELKYKEKMASIGQMAAGIAHEINNPLSFVISNFSSMDHYLKCIMQLQELQGEFLKSIDAGQNEKIKELKSTISQFEEESDISFILEDIRSVVSDSHNGLKRVKNIITDLKSFSHSQSVGVEVCDLERVIDESLKVLSYDIHSSIQIKKSLCEHPNLKSNNGLLQQVLTNLITNAAQALVQAKTESPSIAISTIKKNNSIVIMVKDNGPGIAEENIKKIFDPFFTTKSVGEGTGLGLSVSFNIVEKLGGEMYVDSVLNEYTEFTISLPLG